MAKIPTPVSVANMIPTRPAMVVTYALSKLGTRVLIKLVSISESTARVSTLCSSSSMGIPPFKIDSDQVYEPRSCFSTSAVVKLLNWDEIGYAERLHFAYLYVKIRLNRSPAVLGMKLALL